MSRRKPTPKVKEQVASRAEYRCEYCQALRSYSPSPFDTEHIQPYSLVGLSSFYPLWIFSLLLPWLQ